MYVHEVDVVVRDRYVRLSKKFTAPVEQAQLPKDFDTMAPGAAAKALGVAWRQQEERFGQCNAKLSTIEFIQGTLPEADQ